MDTTKSAVTPPPPGAPDAEPAQTYLCYKTKCPKQQPTATFEDQFGTHNVIVKTTALVCAPVSVVTTTTMPFVCATASDCPGMDTECQLRSCMAGACGFTFAANGRGVEKREVGRSGAEQLACYQPCQRPASSDDDFAFGCGAG